MPSAGKFYMSPCKTNWRHEPPYTYGVVPGSGIWPASNLNLLELQLLGVSQIRKDPATQVKKVVEYTGARRVGVGVFGWGGGI